MHGFGIFFWNNGDKYEGNYEDNLKHGFGTFYWHNSKKIYRGNWRFGLQNGDGEFLFNIFFSKNLKLFFF